MVTPENAPKPLTQKEAETIAADLQDPQPIIPSAIIDAICNLEDWRPSHAISPTFEDLASSGLTLEDHKIIRKLKEKMEELP